jgi:hypothetical protein
MENLLQQMRAEDKQPVLLLPVISDSFNWTTEQRFLTGGKLLFR